jgi:hypothetical protein
MAIFDKSDSPSGTDFGVLFKWGVFAILLVAALAFIGNAVGVFGKAASAPGRVVSKTLDTDNIIGNYEWFYDTNAAYTSRLGQIAAHRKLVAGETVAAEKSRLNIELVGMEQTCRDLATKYNANSEKANRALFKSKNLPETLSASACDK